MQKCKHCERIRPDYIADPSCAKGGYCEWENVKRTIALADNYPKPVKWRPMWLPLLHYGAIYQDTRSVQFSAQPELTFKPRGLMFWNLPPDAMLDYCRITNQEAILAGHGSLPAAAFARAESYESLKARVENGEEFFNEWISAPFMSPANRVSLQLSSYMMYGFQETKAAFWGHAINS